MTVWFENISIKIKELELGKIIQKSGWKRTTYIITTKIYWSMKSEERGLSRKHIIESVKASLQRLQLPYIDVVIIYKADSMCPMEGKSFTCFLIYLFQQARTMQACKCLLFVLGSSSYNTRRGRVYNSILLEALRKIRARFSLRT